MAGPRAIVAIPTLHGGAPLQTCLGKLEEQTWIDFEIVVVDNSGGAVAAELGASPRRRVIIPDRNVGYGEAVNRAAASSDAELICCLNDDAYPRPDWLAELIGAADEHPEAGMFAPRIVLRSAPDRLDSAGMAVYPDGTTKQRGHGAPAADYSSLEEALLPSGCAALYRREMFDALGGFDPDYFLYHEDADLGLRGRLAGWTCLYVPSAVVEHDYSGSAGRASRLKAFHVERNRLYTVIKNFPPALWPLTPFYALRRYWAHWRAARRGRGLAGEWQGQGALGLGLIVWSAHWQALLALPRLWRKRSKSSLGGPGAFWRLLRRFRLSADEIAAQ